MASTSNLLAARGTIATHNTYVVRLQVLPHNLRLTHLSLPHLPLLSTMASIPQPQKGRGGVISVLDVFIQALDLAKGACGIPQAQIAFGAASLLLTMIRVRSSLLWEGQLLTHVYLGHDDQRPGLLRTWADLRWCMPSALLEIEGETSR